MQIQKKRLIIRKLLGNLYHNIETIYPITQSKQILLITLQKTRIFVSECINLSLLTQYQEGKIKKEKTPEKNLNNFFKFCATEYLLTENEISKIKQLFEIARIQRQSTMDFKRKENIIILTKDLSIKQISIEKIRDFVKIGQKIYQKI